MANTQDCPRLTELPWEIIVEIFVWAGPGAAYRASLACRRLASLSDDPGLWRTYAHALMPQIMLDTLLHRERAGSGVDWRGQCRARTPRKADGIDCGGQRTEYTSGGGVIVRRGPFLNQDRRQPDTEIHLAFDAHRCQSRAREKPDVTLCRHVYANGDVRTYTEMEDGTQKTLWFRISPQCPNKNIASRVIYGEWDDMIIDTLTCTGPSQFRIFWRCVMCDRDAFQEYLQHYMAIDEVTKKAWLDAMTANARMGSPCMRRCDDALPVAWVNAARPRWTSIYTPEHDADDGPLAFLSNGTLVYARDAAWWLDFLDHCGIAPLDPTTGQAIAAHIYIVSASLFDLEPTWVGAAVADAHARVVTLAADGTDLLFGSAADNAVWCLVHMRAVDAISMGGMAHAARCGDARRRFAMGNLDLCNDTDASAYMGICPLEGVDVRDVRVPAPSDTRADQASLARSRLTDVTLVGRTFCSSSFAGSIWTRCTFTECCFKSCVFVDAVFDGCIFVRCTFFADDGILSFSEPVPIDDRACSILKRCGCRRVCDIIES